MDTLKDKIVSILLYYLKYCLYLLLLLTISSSTFAASISYTGVTGGNWNVPGNWSGSALPTSSDDVTINGKTVVIQSGDAIAINRLLVQTSATTAGILNITGGSLTINQTTGNASNDACFLMGGTINNSAGTVNINNAITLATGSGLRLGTSAGAFKASSTFNNTGLGTLSVSTPMSTNGTPCILFNQNDAGYHPTFTTGGTITITPNSGSATMAIECASPVGAIINGTGTLTAGTSGSPVSYTFIRCQAGNSATLSAKIESGVTLNYFGSNSCIYIVTGGTTGAYSATITNKGTINVGGTTRYPVYILCTNPLSGVASTFDNQGTITANGAFSTGISGVIYMAGAGTLNSFTNSGTINFNTTADQTAECNVIRVSGTNVNASIANSGTITVGSSKSLTNAIVLGDSKSTLTNTGTINIAAGQITGTTGTGNATFNNVGGVLNLTNTTASATLISNTAIALNNNGGTITSGSTANTVTLNTGTPGTVFSGASILNPGGTNTNGKLTFTNSVSLTGTVNMNVSGVNTAGTDYDQIISSTASSMITVSGSLVLTMMASAPIIGTTIDIIKSTNGAITGTFSSVTGLANGWVVLYTAKAISLQYGSLSGLGEKNGSSLSLYLSPNGNDANTGKMGSPFKTLIRAKDVVRFLKQYDTTLKNYHVIFREGTYTLDSTLEFTADDSAPASGKISYEAYTGEVPVISAGLEIAGWTVENGVWVANLPKAGWNFEQLFVNGKRAVRARTPNVGYNYVDLCGAYQNGEDISYKSFYVLNANDVAGIQGNNDEIVTLIYDNWLSGRFRINNYNAQTKLLTFTGNPTNVGSNNNIRRGTRYIIEGIRQAMDAPGEWYLDRTANKVYYIPLATDTLSAIKAYGSNLDKLMIFSGEPDNGSFISNIEFNNLVFRYAATNTPQYGTEMFQASCNVTSNILLDGVNNVNFIGCEVSHVGGYAIQYRNGCTNSKVQNCLLYDLGCGAIYLSDGKYWGKLPTLPNYTKNIVIDNNIIFSGGRVYRDAIAIFAPQCSDLTISHNEIADFYYGGISVGWSSDGLASSSLAQRNSIEYNHIHHIGQGVLSDLGGIYTLGESSGSVLKGNKIHDIAAYYYNAMGIYTDSWTNGIRIEKNLVYKVEDAGYNMGGANSNNTITNNIFALDGNAQTIRFSSTPSFNFSKNIVFSTNGIVTQSSTSTNPNGVFESNLYWNPTGNISFAGKTFEQWQALGKDNLSIKTDPLFVDPLNFNFTLKSGSPASQIGFIPFDISLSGVYGSTSWQTKAASTPTPEREAIKNVPALTPLQFDENFESLVVGTNPPYSVIAPVNVFPAAGVWVGTTTEQSKSGTHSFKMSEGDNSLTGYLPEMTFMPCHFGGATTFSFDVRLASAGSPILNLNFQDRSNVTSVYGFSLSFKDSALYVGSTKIVAIPKDQWVHVGIFNIKTGADANGKCDLTITLPNGTIVQKQLSVNSAWNYLDFLEFNMGGNLAQTVYLDNLKLTNTNGLATLPENITIDSNTLHQNYPNPFSIATVIPFTLNNDAVVTLSVFNTKGQEVAVLMNNHLVAGNYNCNFNAAKLYSGIYFYKIKINEFMVVKKMIIMK
ncbi:MAG: T9SS type A sorting domain-containing protein [Paludibacter sp.]|nr:T9SS type A sorting domain-containing protein [Paludibacter sp.]